MKKKIQEGGIASIPLIHVKKGVELIQVENLDDFFEANRLF